MSKTKIGEEQMSDEYYGLTEKVLMRIAREAEALYKIYTTYRVRRDLFETYLREQYRKENEL